MDHVLGKPTAFPETYSPALLLPMSRTSARAEIGFEVAAAFQGEDVWNAYEFSWLDSRGLPQVAGVRFAVDAASPRFIESKSLKLYLNSFAQSAYGEWDEVAAILSRDLAAAFGARPDVELLRVDAWPTSSAELPGDCLDDLSCTIDRYERAPEVLECSPRGPWVNDVALHSHVFRSLCPITGQPDWASIVVRYGGPTIVPESLLRYLVSFRRHAAFHETTMEQIYFDLKQRCGCDRLLVAGFFQRRGGLDINPARAEGFDHRLRYRLPRQ